MTKRLFYISLSLLCLVSAYQLGADRARADWDGSPTGAVQGGYNEVWFAASGEAWRLEATGWLRASYWDLPVASQEVKFVDGHRLITTSDEGWVFGGTGTGWQHVGPFPGGPVPLKAESWGRVKRRYHD